MRMIHELLQPNVHNIVTGDFNFTTQDGDRYSFVEPMGWKKEDVEAEEWHKLFSESDLLNEIYQPLATYQHTERMSRLDRVYTSAQHVDLLRFSVECKLYHRKSSSDHKPVCFAISTKKFGGGGGEISPVGMEPPQLPRSICKGLGPN